MDAKAAAQKRLNSVARKPHRSEPQDSRESGSRLRGKKAASWIADMLAEAGFEVKTGICDLPTAFSAKVGKGPLHVAICAEYDALPEIGHACGHNIIAAAAVGAGIAASSVADEARSDSFRDRHARRGEMETPEGKSCCLSAALSPEFTPP